MDCVTSKGIVGLVAGAAIAVVSLVATARESDLLHYASAAAYIASAFFAHLPASVLSRTRCSIRQGVTLYLSVTLIAWVAVFNLLYVLFGR